MNPRRIEEGVIIRVVDNEKVVFDRSNEHIHQLNPTAALIWELCDGTQSLQQIEDALMQRFDVRREVLAKDISSLLTSLSSSGLVSDFSQSPLNKEVV